MLDDVNRTYDVEHRVFIRQTKSFVTRDMHAWKARHPLLACGDPDRVYFHAICFAKSPLTQAPAIISPPAAQPETRTPNWLLKISGPTSDFR